MILLLLLVEGYASLTRIILNPVWGHVVTTTLSGTQEVTNTKEAKKNDNIDKSGGNNTITLSHG